MSRISPFDLDDQQTFSEGRIRPLFTLKDLNDDDDEVLEWVNQTYHTELQRIIPYRDTCLKNIALYKNRNPREGAARGSFAETSTAGIANSNAKPARLTVNYLFDLVNQRVARILRVPSNVEIAPANNEYRDRVSAKVVAMWKDYLFYQNDFDTIRMRVSKTAFICGESYLWVRWNPELGSVHPDWLEEEASAKRENRVPRLPVVDDKGEQVVGRDGEPLWIEKAPKTGDVEFKVCTPLNTIVQFTGDFDLSDYFFYEEYVDADELRALYPNAAIDVEEESKDEPEPVSVWRNMAGITNGPQQGKILVRYFRQRPTPFLSSGRWIVSTRTAILENRPLQRGEEGLHLVRLTDYDVEGEQRGASFFTQGKALNAAVNDLTSMHMRNMKLLAHPKWAVPKGSVVKKDALGNDITVVEFSGPIEPQIKVPPPMNQEGMAVKSDLKNDMQLILGASPAERGQIPPNIRSATGLQAMYEQEDMRSSQQNLKQATFVREVVEAAINVAAAYYDKDDRRMLPVVGKGNRYLLKEFDPENLTRGFDVRVRNGNGLPTSKAVRFDMAMQLREAMPTYMTEERLASFMEWGDEDKVLDAATKAQRAAEAENEAMLSMDAIDEPAPFENHIVHWVTHVQELQDRSFKVDVPPEIQAKFIGHVMATEMFMIDAARKNPRYAIELVKIPAWPLFYVPGPEDYMLLDAARTGNPLPLEMVQVLYEQGATALQAAGMGGPQPPAPGQGQGGFNSATNGVGGPGSDNPVKGVQDAPPNARKNMEVLPDEEQQDAQPA